jgi:hypothetical protein
MTRRVFGQSTQLALALLAAGLIGGPRAAGGEAGNLLVDGSFEEPMPRDQFGHVFKHWGGWKYEGECEFRVGQIAHGGKTSCLLFGGGQCKIRIAQTVQAVPPGRYKITAWIRGLEIGEGIWRMNTEFAFNDKYMRLNKAGTFGWTPVTYVADVKEKKDVGPSFGMWAPGYLWIDDVAMVRVGQDVPLTPEPVVGEEERPIAPPGPVGAGSVRCPECGYKNMPAWGHCYACGAQLGTVKVAKGPDIRVLTDFSGKHPFENGRVVDGHGPKAGKALLVEKEYTVWSGPQDWSGYDYLKVDLWTAATRPVNLYIEMRDVQTRDYWTRVNLESIVPPGASTLVLPLAQLYVGEKSRPGRNLMLGNVTQLVLGIGPTPAAPVEFSNLRIERDVETPKMFFDGLYAFSFGPANSPLMPGFTRISPATVYGKGRGYGLKNAQIWRTFDVLQPEPLYESFTCIENGGLAVDVPDGKYHVFLNIDNPSGFWGEYQVYRQRAVLAQGKPVVEESMTFDSLKKKYFRFWKTEDSPQENTFDKYQRAYYQEKEFDVDVTGGQLNLGFRGENFGCSVSAVIIYPAAKAAEGRKFLDYVVARRRFYFDNYFHRVLHKPSGDPLAPTAEDTRRGYVIFARDTMQDVYYNDTPKQVEIIRLPSPSGRGTRERVPGGEGEVGATSKVSPPHPNPLPEGEGTSRPHPNPLPEGEGTSRPHPNPLPRGEGTGDTVTGFGFAGQYEPLNVAICPLADLGKVQMAVSDLAGPGTIAAKDIAVGYVSYRVTRVSSDGAVYTIDPRLIIPEPAVEVRKGITRRFWLTIRPPVGTPAGLYRGQITITPERGQPAQVPVEYRVYPGTLDAVDIPVGPWSHTIGIPWDGSDPAAKDWNDTMAERSLEKLHDYGFTSFSGLPEVRYLGFKDGKPQLDFSEGDRQMARARRCGFTMPVITYCGFPGLDLYHKDEGAMRAAGFSDYSRFIKAIFSAVQAHAQQANWLPVYWNLGDEPIGDELTRAAESAEAYRAAFPKGPPWFTAATSFESAKEDDPHCRFAKALHVANLNGHNEPTVELLHRLGADWAFYNGGNRWTYGIYLYKAAKQFNMKFRLNWHWNATAGDPYYALDCREDDYAWCNSDPQGRLIPSVYFERDMRGGLTDYRYMLTLARLAREKHDAAGEALIQKRLAAFKLGQREHDELFPPSDWQAFRLQMAEAIARLRGGR